MALVQTAQIFCYYWSCKNFADKANNVKDIPTRNVLNKLVLLYSITKILSRSNGFYENNIISGSIFKIIFKTKQKLLNELRNEAIGLVEAFSYNDNTLKTAIGRSDGKPYENLL